MSNNFDASPANVARQVLEFVPIMMRAVSTPMRDSGDANSMLQMMTMGALKDGPRPFKDLIAHRKVSAPTMSRSIEAMVRRGWIERIRHPNDKRQILLKLTPDGQAELAKFERRMHEHMRQLLDPLSAAERAHALEGIQSLRKAFAPVMEMPLTHCKPHVTTHADGQASGIKHHLDVGQKPEPGSGQEVDQALDSADSDASV